MARTTYVTAYTLQIDRATPQHVLYTRSLTWLPQYKYIYISISKIISRNNKLNKEMTTVI